MSGGTLVFAEIIRLLGARTGLSFDPGRTQNADLGIRRAMARAAIADPELYLARLETDKALLDDLVDELTIGETYFFREPAQFRFIRREVLPEIRRRRGADSMVRAWSAGCASGEEAYTLAMVFAEEGLDRQASILATDVSRAALAKAERAIYGAWSLRGEGPDSARAHLIPRGDRHVVADPIRRLVTFEYLNLALDVYPSVVTGTWGLDLILCRNVLIYFDPETVANVARRLHDALAPGGCLITASSDPPLAGAAPFETVATDEGIFYRRADVAALAPFAATPLDGLVVPAFALATVFEPAAKSVAPRISRDGILAAPADDLAALVAEARSDLATGHYARAVERTARRLNDPEASALHIRALANLDLARAEAASAEAVKQHSLSSDLHYLRAVILHGMGRDQDAAEAARRAIYLDRTLAIAHFTLGSILRVRGDREGAWRAFRNARDLCAARPADEALPLTDGEPAGRLGREAETQMAWLESMTGRPR